MLLGATYLFVPGAMLAKWEVVFIEGIMAVGFGYGFLAERRQVKANQGEYA